MKACPKGSHLITVRELAEIAQTRGAAGIVEVEDYDPKMKNFKMISATTSSGDREVFYYGYAGYQRPSGDLGLMFWSSSLDWDNKKKVYSIDNDGFIYNGILPTNYLGVMCVRDQSH